MIDMRLERIQAFIKEQNWDYQYSEMDGCGSIDWIAHGLRYHVWEFEDGGAESNVRSGGKMEEFSGDYEAEIIEVLKNWQNM